MTPLCDALALPLGERAAELEPRLASLLAEAHAAWPEVHVDDAAFMRHLGPRLSRGVPIEDALGRVHAADLYLACACASGDKDALLAFQKRFLPSVRSTLARFAPQDVVDEIAQDLMTKLFTGDPSHIHKYEGRGELSAWLQISATRDAYKLLSKRRGRRNEIDALAERAIIVDDPELHRLKEAYREHFKRAFQRAFQELSVRHRNLLRLEYLDGLNIDRIGALYGVHRATVARWRIKARENLFKHTRRIFEEDIEAPDFDSIVRLIDSQLDVSLHRLLEDDENPE